MLFSSETEKRGAGEGGAGNVRSDEDNNWGMDDNIDVNAVCSYTSKYIGVTCYSKECFVSSTVPSCICCSIELLHDLFPRWYTLVCSR